jgi:phosphomevalonate kinase
MVLIGISGKIGVGKDYITSNVVIQALKNSSYLQLAFADQIKINVMSKKNISYDDVYFKKTQESRQLLQQEGSIGRNEDSDIWIKYFKNWVNVHSKRGIQNIIISDCRYKNEFDYIKQNGGIIIKVVAPDRNNDRLIQEASSSGIFDNESFNKIKNHQSECDLDDLSDCNFDIVINNRKDTNLDIEYLQNKFIQLLS